MFAVLNASDVKAITQYNVVEKQLSGHFNVYKSAIIASSIKTYFM